MTQRKRPNIILIVLDTQRVDRLSCYGHTVPTSPSLDRLAEEGTLFEHAISPAQWTIPAHASMFTGQYPLLHQTVQSDRALPPDLPTMTEMLRDNGYRTFAFWSSLISCTYLPCGVVSSCRYCLINCSTMATDEVRSLILSLSYLSILILRSSTFKMLAERSLSLFKTAISCLTLGCNAKKGANNMASTIWRQHGRATSLPDGEWIRHRIPVAGKSPRSRRNPGCALHL